MSSSSSSARRASRRSSYAPRVLQVEDLLLAPLRRHGGAPAQHPLGVAAGGLGVEVDHLRLDPQAELHAAAGHVVDQRAQPLRPDGGVDGPVAEPGGVVAAAEEPAVVEDEALDPDGGGGVGELGEPVEGVVEVDRLPRVGDDGPLGAGPRRDGAQVGVEAVAHRVEAGARPRAEHVRGVVGLAGGEDHLARVEQLTAAEQALALGRALGVVACGCRSTRCARPTPRRCRR